MNKALWSRFKAGWNSARESSELSLCYLCPFAKKTEVIEPRVSPAEFLGLDKSFYAPTDRSTYQPNEGSTQCECCFTGWVDEKMNEGKICLRCQKWVTKTSTALWIEEHDAKTKRLWSRRAICVECFLSKLKTKRG